VHTRIGRLRLDSLLVFSVLRWVFVAVVGAAFTAWFVAEPEIPRSAQLAEVARVVANLVLLAMLAGVGGMAMVQFWKVLFRPRGAFHRRELEKYFATDTDELLRLLGADKGVDLAEVLDSPAEILLAQISLAAEHLMLQPWRSEALLSRLAGSLGKEAMALYRSLQPSPESDETADAPRSPQPSSESDEAADALSDALSRVRYLVERNLDVLLVTFRARWRRRVRLLAVAVTAALGALAIVVAGVGPIVKVLGILSAGLLGGFFSWLARDVTALAERRRS